MKLIFTHPNPIIVGNIKNILENTGVKTELRNQFASGGVGELAPTEAWQELWLVNDKNEVKAVAIIEQAEKESKEEWHCENCGEVNAGSFEVCWQCESSRPK